jgi:hypothetical protein
MKGFSRDKDSSGAGASAQVLLSWKNSLQSSSSSALAGRNVGSCLSGQENGFTNGLGLLRGVDSLSSSENRLHTEKRRRAGGSHEGISDGFVFVTFSPVEPLFITGGSRATLGLTDEALWELEMGTEDQYAFERSSYSKPIKSPNLVELSSQWDTHWENDEDGIWRFNYITKRIDYNIITSFSYLDEDSNAEFGNLELVAGRPRTMTGGSSSDDQSIASLSSGLDRYSNFMILVFALIVSIALNLNIPIYFNYSITLDVLMEVGSNFCEDISIQTVNDDVSDAMSRGTPIEIDVTRPNVMKELLTSTTEDVTYEVNHFCIYFLNAA